MYAVAQIGGHQYRVAEGDLIYVDRRSEENGDSFSINEVLMLNDEGTVTIGTPTVEGASIKATLVEHVKADKVVVFKKKRRKGYKKKRGHRQPMSQIKIESISASGVQEQETEKEEQETAQQTEDSNEQEVSTDLSAKEAINHIENTPLDELEGFVPDDESRVTVQRAWDDKQDEE